MLSLSQLEDAARRAFGGLRAMGNIGDTERDAIARAIAAAIHANNEDLQKELDDLKKP